MVDHIPCTALCYKTKIVGGLTPLNNLIPFRTNWSKVLSTHVVRAAHSSTASLGPGL